ncbi:MAG TPA: tetratricopeptide repeat protein [Kofleriaceae bacterium]|nr:tetratricopeptide repeat protein [Kofleriaceae bacterium]
MRSRSLPLFCMFCVILAAAAFATISGEPSAAAQSDSTRAQARDHYIAGKKLYDAGAYQQAIGEFQTADQMSPSGVNDFNIALCYDKLGDPSNAVQFYKSYLTRVPDAQNRADVEAKIAKLADAVKKQEADAAAKKAADDAAAAAAAKDAAAKKAADDAAAAAAAKKAADDAAAAAAAANAAHAAGPGGAGGTMTPGTSITSNGSGTVAPAGPANTGDPDLDRVAAIDVNSIRDQRNGGATGPAPSSGAGTGAVGTGAGAGATADATANGAGAGGPATASLGNGANGAPTNPGGAPEQPKPQPAYKKWWFWVIVGVGVVVAINVLSSSPQSGQTRNGLTDMPMPMPQPSTGGVTLFNF